MEKLLLDANILMGVLNRKDQFHVRCLNFFQEIHNRNKGGVRIQIVIPLHLAIEVNIKLRKKKRNNEWESFNPIEFSGPEYYPIDLKLLNRIQDEKLYDKFNVLSSLDAIYAIIAYIEKMTLVTLDSDFKKVDDKIKVKFI